MPWNCFNRRIAIRRVGRKVMKLVRPCCSPYPILAGTKLLRIKVSQSAGEKPRMRQDFARVSSPHDVANSCEFLTDGQTSYCRNALFRKGGGSKSERAARDKASDCLLFVSASVSTPTKRGRLDDGAKNSHVFTSKHGNPQAPRKVV